MALRSTKTPTLPKGLPPLPATPTTYIIFIQQKQWNNVQAAMQHDDVLLVEGYGMHAPRFAEITVCTAQVATNALHAATRQAQTAAPVRAGAEINVGRRSARPASPALPPAESRQGRPRQRLPTR